MKLLTMMIVVFTSVFNISDIVAQDYVPAVPEAYRSRISFETDPFSFLLRGYSFHVRYQPMFSERFLIGLGTYGMDLPDQIVNLNGLNSDRGWDVRIRNAWLVYAEWYASEVNNGWFIGEQIGFQSFDVSLSREVSGSTQFNNLLIMTYGGYSWHPYKGSLYIKPWIGLGFTDKVDGVNKVGPMTYEVGPLFGFVTFHIGYTF